MLLSEFIYNLKENSFKERDTLELYSCKEKLVKHLIKDGMPSRKVEEWKYFDTNIFLKKDWKISKSKNISITKTNTKINEKTTNIKIIFKNGAYNPNSSDLGNGDLIEIHSLKKYIQKNPEFLSKVYSDPSKYVEKKISNIKDTKALSLVSLNALLKEDGVVFVIKKDSELPEIIEINHFNNETESNLIINPYFFIVAEKNSKAKVLETFNSYNKNIWTNEVAQIYLENNASLDISRVQLHKNNGIRTSFLLCKLESNSSLSCFNFNEGVIRDDIRVTMNNENSNCEINGIITADKSNTSDTFCKITHVSKNCSSNQNWRLISASSGKSSVQGKIRVEKGASKSEGHFNSKTLLLGENSKAEAKPELEIMEEDIVCSHGASIGELDKDALFYMQTRGIKIEESFSHRISTET